MNDIEDKPQHATRMQLAGEVAQQVEIHAIALINLVCSNKGSTEPEGAFVVSIETGASPDFNPEERVLLVEAKCCMNAAPEGTEEPVVQVDATFLLTYQIADPDEFTQEHYEAFAGINGMFNLWPYWRELVQSMTLRMGLPPLTLPVRRALTVKNKKDEE